MRRDDGCGERDSRNVEGEQGHEAGGTIDADGMRPLHNKHAVKADDPQLARTHPTLTACFPHGADRPGFLVFGDQLVGRRGVQRSGCVPGTMCRDIQILWLAVMLDLEYDRECSPPRCCRG